MSDELQSVETAETVDAVIETPSEATETVVSEDDAMSAIYDKLVTNNGADRAGDGKFKSPKAESVVPAPVDGSPGGEEGAADEPVEADAGVQQVPAAPSHLPGEIKAAWDKMPPEAQKAFAEYTGQQDKKFSELGRELQKYKPVNDVVNEFGEYFDGTKGRHDPAQAMRALFNIQRNMDTDPVGTLYKIAQTYGIHDQLFQGNADSSREISSLTQTIQQLRQQVSQLADGDYIQDQFSRFNEQESVNRTIEDFAKSATFYADVEDALPSFIDLARSRLGDTAKPGELLKTAYDMAVNAIPEVRAKVKATEQVDVANKPDSKRAESAKRAASINVRSNGTGKQSFSTEEEAMAAVYDKHFAA